MTMTKQAVVEQLAKLRVLPIMVADDVDQAIACVNTLAENGLPAVEITLRSPNAMTVLREVVKACPNVLVGAGTILTPAQLHDVRNSGASFAISPGITPVMAKAAQELGLPYLPGVATASELMLALEHGFDVLKLFPADVVGGMKMAKALGGPFPQVRFCLTGGVTIETMPTMLQQSNIVCVGGSWMCPASLIASNDWAAIAQLTKTAAAA
jgi:2-dehydro-3-deoxyphosphogluconate aldolase/(4S)-4-hydroxy-2-oxoglutarate aldolase